MTERIYPEGTPVKVIDLSSDHAFECGRVSDVLTSYCFEVEFDDGEKEDVLGHRLRVAEAS